jgi:hypothetical protein
MGASISQNFHVDYSVIVTPPVRNLRRLSVSDEPSNAQVAVSWQRSSCAAFEAQHCCACPAPGGGGMKG